MATQVTLDGLIGSLRLEMTEGVVFPGVVRGWSVLGGECAMCEEEWDIEVVLAVAVAQRAGDPVTGTEACQMALRFSLDLENRQRARQVIFVWKEYWYTSCMSSVNCRICRRCTIKDLDGEELAPWFDQYFHLRVGSGELERCFHCVVGVCRVSEQWSSQIRV
eukprot:scaffold102508_cov34-Attheya_sp.AAC.1